MKYFAIFAAIFVAFLLGLCFLGDDSFGEQIPSSEVPPIVDDEILGDDKPVISPDDNEESNIPTIEEYVTTDEELYIYELIYSDLSTQYETHTAYINLSNNEEKYDEDNVYGLMYVDYENAYVDENNNTYFGSGFIAFPNQNRLNRVSPEVGYELISMNTSYDEEYSYIYNYYTEDVYMHCVYNNKYIKYEIVNGVINYSEEEFSRGMEVDEKRGNIWNYDTNEYEYIVTEQDYVPVIGEGLSNISNYELIVEEINNILYLQEANLTYEQILTYASQSKEALISYFLGLQKETFFGYPTSDLISIAEGLDPLQHIRLTVTETGVQKIDFIEINQIPTLMEKALTVFVCANLVAGGIVCEVLGTFYPFLKPILSPIAGASIGVGIESFMQVVVENTPTTEINWAKVGLAAASGAIAGFVGNKLAAINNIFVREGVDLLCDGLIGGGEFFATALIDGKTFEDACQEFGYGVITSVALSGIFKVGMYGVQKVFGIIKKGVVSQVNVLDGNDAKKLQKLDASELSEKVVKKGTKESTETISKRLKQYADEMGQLYREGDKLIPNNKYIVNGYEYATDAEGRIILASGKLSMNTSGLPKKTINDSIDAIANGDNLITDHKGHLIGEMFNGDNHIGNLVAMDGNVNQSTFKRFENFWYKCLSEGKEVYVEIIPEYLDDNFRPTQFKIYFEIDGRMHMLNNVTDDVTLIDGFYVISNELKTLTNN